MWQLSPGQDEPFCAGRDLKERAADNAVGIQARASDSLGSDTLGLFPRTWKPSLPLSTVMPWPVAGLSPRCVTCASLQ